jgi:hypothetical protein
MFGSAQFSRMIQFGLRKVIYWTGGMTMTRLHCGLEGQVNMTLALHRLGMAGGYHCCIAFRFQIPGHRAGSVASWVFCILHLMYGVQELIELEWVACYGTSRHTGLDISMKCSRIDV